MKSLRILAILLIMIGFGFSTAHSQALVLKDFNWFLKTSDGIYPAVDMMGVFTPSGNILHKQTFMINHEDSLVPEKGMNKVAFKTWVRFNGVVHEMISVDGKVYPDGKVFIIFHSNGAGEITPSNKLKE